MPSIARRLVMRGALCTGIGALTSIALAWGCALKPIQVIGPAYRLSFVGSNNGGFVRDTFGATTIFLIQNFQSEKMNAGNGHPQG